MKHLYKEVIVTLEAPRKKEEETKEQYKQRVLNSAKAFAEYQQAEVISIHPILAKKTSKSIIHMKRKDILLDDWIAQLSVLKNVLDVSNNINLNVKYTHTPITTNDYFFSMQQTYLDLINVTKAWNVSTGNEEVVIVVMDTGVDKTHPDLQDKFCLDMDGNPGRNVANVSTPYDIVDGQGHGTGMSGAIVAIANNATGISGINWNSKILPVKCLDNEGNGSLSYIISGIEYILDQKDKGLNVRIINMSLGSWLSLTSFNNTNYSLYLIFQQLLEENIFVVAAAGNEYQNVDNPGGVGTNPSEPTESYINKRPVPGAYSIYFNNIICVGSISAEKQRSAFSNYSPTYVSLFAPGESIPTTHIDNTYVSTAGTSIATAIVTGVISLLISNKPTLNYKQIKHIVMNTTQDKTVFDYTNFSQKGVIDAYNMLLYKTKTTAKVTKSTPGFKFTLKG